MRSSFILKSFPNLRLQILSDLHLDTRRSFVWSNLIVHQASYLAILGDLAPAKHPHYKRFLSTLSHKFSHIFVIAGNHEYMRKLVGSEPTP